MNRDLLCMILVLACSVIACFSSAFAESPPATAPAPPPSFKVEGFATLSGYGVETVTGGRGGPTVEVRTAEAFRAAAERTDVPAKTLRDNTPRVIKVIADIDLGELANDKPGNELKAVGRVPVRSNTTIYSPGAAFTIRHGILELHGAHNVILRNLKFRDLWELDPTDKYDRFGWDYVRITNSGATPSHHVWVDHCDFGKCYDGQCDITHGSDLITISWCHFAGDERGPHKKSMLIGHSSSDSAAATDRGTLNVTLHHNWFENIDDRAPRVRFGNVHVYNDFVDGAQNGTISVTSAVTLVENSVFNDARIATTYSHAADSMDKDRAGTLVVVNSLNLKPRPAAQNPSAREKFEIENNFKSSVSREEIKFNAPAHFKWPDLAQLPYRYKLDQTENVPDLLRRFAGTGKLSDTELSEKMP